MGLDIGTLVGFVDLDASKFDQTLTRTQQRMTTFAGTRVRDVALGADASRVETATRQAAASIRALESNSPTVRIDSDASTVQADLARIESQLRSIPPGDVQVDADVTTALSQLDRLQSQVRSLPDGTVEIDADTAAAIADLQRMTDAAGTAGAQGGADAGDGIVEGITSRTGVLASRSGPIVGSIIGAIGAVASLTPGVLLINAITKGMETQASRGLFSARTGLDAETAKRFGVSAGESYASNFGTSVTDNLDAARVALQSGLLGGDATQSEITNTINGLTTVSEILGAEVPEVARAAGQAVKTGLADSTTSALDLITRAYQGGLDVSGDLLDTITEYGTQFRKVGLDGPTAMGLVAQAVRGGARDTDVAADAIKEFSIRAIDGSKATVDAYKAIGLNAEDMQKKIAAGGPAAQEGLEQVFTALRDIEDPAALSAAAVGLFGTQAEDLGAALSSFDLAAAREEFADTAGTLAEATAAIGANPAAAVETAKRSIEVSAQGIQEALAVAFGPQIQNFAGYISTHREEIISFMFDAASATFDFAIEVYGLGAAGLRAGADLIESFSTAGTAIYSSLGGILGAADAAFGWIPGVGDRLAIAEDKFDRLAVGSELSSAAIVGGMRTAADGIDNGLIPILESAQGRLDEFGIPAIAQAALADATTEASSSIAEVGTAADGTQLQLEDLSGSLDLSTEAGSALDGQLRTAAEAMQAAATAGAAAGAGADELTSSATASREALVNQLTALGFTREAAEQLADSYAQVPAIVQTAVTATGLSDVNSQAQALLTRLNSIDGKKVTTTIQQVTSYVRQENAMASRAPSGSAAGGLIPGSPSSVDNHLRPMATGEFVVRSGQVRKNLPLLKAINDGTLGIGEGLAAGGIVGSVAGDDGAGTTVSRPWLSRAQTNAALVMPVDDGRYRSALIQVTQLLEQQATAEATLTTAREDGKTALEAMKRSLDDEADAAKARNDAREDNAAEALADLKDRQRAEKDALDSKDDAGQRALQTRQDAELKVAEDAIAAAKAAHAAAEKDLKRKIDDRLDSEEAAIARRVTEAEDALTATKEAATVATKELGDAEAELEQTRQAALATAQKVASALSTGASLSALLGDTSAADLERTAAALEKVQAAAGAAGQNARGETRGAALERRTSALQDLTEQATAFATAQAAYGVAPVAVQAGLDQQIARIKELGAAYGLTEAAIAEMTGQLKATQLDGGSLLGSAQRELAQVKEMGALLERLRAAGLDQSLLEELAGQGTAGLSTARALANGDPEVIKELSATRQEIESLSRDIGAEFAAALYDPSRVSKVSVDGEVAIDAFTLSDLADKLGAVIAANPPLVSLDGQLVSAVLAQRAADTAHQVAS